MNKTIHIIRYHTLCGCTKDVIVPEHPYYTQYIPIITMPSIKFIHNDDSEFARIQCSRRFDRYDEDKNGDVIVYHYREIYER